MFDGPDDSDDSIQGWEEESEEEISDADEADNSGDEQRPSISEICEQTQNRNCRVRKHQTFLEMNCGERDEVVDVAYPQCLLPSLINCLQTDSRTH